jgi:probable phosphoglycerate mutase
MHHAPPSPSACRLCLIRHGETDWNAQRRLQGHIDIPLNPTGVGQAVSAAASLPGGVFTACYSSDLVRALHTAQAACSALGLVPRTLPALRERHYGHFQGLTYDEAARRHAEDYARFEARDPDFAFADGGESLRGFAQRIVACLTDIVACHPGETVLVVTHGGVLDIAHRVATGKSLTASRDFTIPNAALNWIRHDGGWSLESWADLRHLQGARDELPNA